MTEEEQLEFALRMSMASMAEESEQITNTLYSCVKLSDLASELSGKEGVEEMDTGGAAQVEIHDHVL